MFARLIFSIVDFGARCELGKTPQPVADARQFLRARHIESAECRFDVLAIETQPGAKPSVRLHKGAFNAHRN